MYSQIKGQTVTLITSEQTGVNDFNEPIYTDTEVEVDNVLIEPASNDAIVSEIQLSGKHVSYILHIPKGDTHNWEDAKVKFNGSTWQTFGDCLVWDENMTPLDWNKKVKVEKYEC